MEYYDPNIRFTARGVMTQTYCWLKEAGFWTRLIFPDWNFPFIALFVRQCFLLFFFFLNQVENIGKKSKFDPFYDLQEVTNDISCSWFQPLILFSSCRKKDLKIAVNSIVIFRFMWPNSSFLTMLEAAAHHRRAKKMKLIYIYIYINSNCSLYTS